VTIKYGDKRIYSVTREHIPHAIEMGFPGEMFHYTSFFVKFVKHTTKCFANVRVHFAKNYACGFPS